MKHSRTYYRSSRFETGSATASGGASLSTIVFVVFLILKLTGNIDWSWWWVTSPLWIPTLLVAVLLIMYFTLRRSFTWWGQLAKSKALKITLAVLMILSMILIMIATLL